MVSIASVLRFVPAVQWRAYSHVGLDSLERFFGAGNRYFVTTIDVGQTPQVWTVYSAIWRFF
ncbi:MAG: hypothetical protein Aurels2KO_15060 [Aureliella sp.]